MNLRVVLKRILLILEFMVKKKVLGLFKSNFFNNLAREGHFSSCFYRETYEKSLENPDIYCQLQMFRIQLIDNMSDK